MGIFESTYSSSKFNSDIQPEFVAVVDDDVHIAQAIAMWLDMLGIDSQVFGSGATGLVRLLNKA